MARAVTDCALAYSVLTGAPSTGDDVAGLRAGVLNALPPLAPDLVLTPRDERALALADQIEGLGIPCREVALPVPEANLWPVFYAEAAETHRRTFPAQREAYGPTIRAKLDGAQHVDPDALDAAYRALTVWRERAEREPDVDVFISPTLGVTEIPRADVDELEIRVPFSAYTRVFSFLGWPAIAIGGVQIAARQPGPMFAAALAWERSYAPPR
jgi:Asp-tRNA(Asn)/Glu-tRNA(Gln) amidotransferase A subunit family amidase